MRKIIVYSHFHHTLLIEHLIFEFNFFCMVKCFNMDEIKFAKFENLPT
jgi:hypothetical protein